MRQNRRWAAAGVWDGTRALVLAAGLVAVLPGGVSSAPMSHDPWKLAVGRALGDPTHKAAAGRCENCHTLKAAEAEPNTSYINNAARTIQSYKISLKRPIVDEDNLGCTFCHSSRLDNTTMDDVLSDFEFAPNQHPVGVTVAGANNNDEYLSGNGTAPLADRLQCLDCHQPSLLGYPYHEGRTTDPGIWAGTWNKADNAAALQGVTAAADKGKAHCLTCHDELGAQNAPTRPKMGHLGWGSYNPATNAMRDPSGQYLQAAATASCTVCHDTHTSIKADLMQDGLDRGTADPGRRAIVESDCVAVCHAIGQFTTSGHGGRIGINTTTCTPCHSASISHRDTTDAGTVRRLGMLYENAQKSTLTLDRSADGLDNDMNGVKDDEPSFAYSKTSICRTCHRNYAGHGSGGRNTGCLDCHDVHGDDAVGNVAMIRTVVLGEPTTFTQADRSAHAYYKGTGDGTGICDNAACHRAGGLEAAHKGGTGAELAQLCADCHTFSHKIAPNTEDSFKLAKPAGAQ